MILMSHVRWDIGSLSSSVIAFLRVIDPPLEQLGLGSSSFYDKFTVYAVAVNIWDHPGGGEVHDDGRQ